MAIGLIMHIIIDSSWVVCVCWCVAVCLLRAIASFVVVVVVVVCGVLMTPEIERSRYEKA